MGEREGVQYERWGGGEESPLGLSCETMYGGRGRTETLFVSRPSPADHLPSAPPNG